MKPIKSVTILSVLVVALGLPSMAAGDAPRTVQGEVVEVTQQTGNAGELDTLLVRTRQGEQVRLALGQAGSSRGQVMAGDTISARICPQGTTGPGYPVRSMKVRRTGETFQYRDAQGQMLQVQNRSREQRRDGTGTAAGSATQTRTRARIHEPGTGSCPRGSASGNRRGGGGTRR